MRAGLGKMGRWELGQGEGEVDQGLGQRGKQPKGKFGQAEKMKEGELDSRVGEGGNLNFSGVSFISQGISGISGIKVIGSKERKEGK